MQVKTVNDVAYISRLLGSVDSTLRCSGFRVGGHDRSADSFVYFMPPSHSDIVEMVQEKYELQIRDILKCYRQELLDLATKLVQGDVDVVQPVEAKEVI